MAASRPAGMIGFTVRQVREERRADAPLFVHPEWERTFPWLIQGTTGRDAGNFASVSEQTTVVMQAQWTRLRAATGMRAAVLGRQVHGARVLTHGTFADGLLIADNCDGHITGERSILLAVSIADCVPVFVVDPVRLNVAVLHAGWRGIAAGIIHECIALTGTNVHIHLGPAICGACYEVGPEVHSALGSPASPNKAFVDLRTVLAQQSIAAGVAPERITASSWCTRCGESPFFSHRGGHAERQVGVIGIA